MEPATGKCLSHRSVLIVAHRNSTALLLGYTAENYEFSCDDVLRLIQLAFARISIQVVKTYLIAINQGYIGLPERLPIFLERIFEFHSFVIGLKWKYRQMLLKENKRDSDWKPFMVKNFMQVERTITTFQNMVEDVLYYPED